MFRGERPAAGRRRQFHQVGVENVGRVAPLIDAECIAMLMDYLHSIGITDAKLAINTRGVMEDRGPAGKLLADYFGRHIDGMCDDCKARLTRNVWRILDCKQEACRKVVAEAPDYVASFSEASRAYFDEVRAALTALGVEYTVDPLLVRGLDYYVHTVFEVTHGGLGAQTAIAGGGRYELYLPGQKKPVPGVGFAAGMERLLMGAGRARSRRARLPGPAGLPGRPRRRGADCESEAGRRLRRAGIRVELELEERSFKAQLRNVNKSGALLAVIRGEEELKKGVAAVKTMATGEQIELADPELAGYLIGFARNL